MQLKYVEDVHDDGDDDDDDEAVQGYDCCILCEEFHFG